MGLGEKLEKNLLKLSLSKRKIKYTPEHKILTTKGYKPANKLKSNDLIMCLRDISHKDNIIAPALNKDQLQIIYGSYLGDGNIDITKKNRCELRCNHGIKQEKYCNLVQLKCLMLIN